ncbi:MAG: hypothetical protein KJO66_03330 [Gammaproteobacteria bacterium]|nr:hypothetical protein [Gammaproteobacteria bacterium]
MRQGQRSTFHSPGCQRQQHTYGREIGQGQRSTFYCPRCRHQQHPDGIAGL